MYQGYSNETKTFANMYTSLQEHKDTLKQIEENLFCAIITGIISDNEGFRKEAYWDLRRYSIGYGTKSFKGETITEEEALRRLNNAVAYALEKAPSLVLNSTWKLLSPPRKSVLVEMIYVLGLRGALKFENTLDFIENGCFEDAAIELKDSKWHTQAQTRVQQVASRLHTGEWLT